MKIWHHGFSTHIRFNNRELIFINRWREARQLGAGIGHLRSGRVRWVFFTQYRFGLLGW